jgi:Helix-turn-helix domain
MDLAGYVVNAVLVEGRSVGEVAAAHGVSRSWLYELLSRYRVAGEEGLEAQSKRPRSSPTRVPSGHRGRDRRAARVPHRGGPGRGCADDPLAPADPTPATPDLGAVGGHHLAGPVPAEFVVARLTSGPAAPGGASPPTCPMSAGRPTPPIGAWPTATTWRSSTSSTTTSDCWSPPGPSTRPSRPMSSPPSTKPPPATGSGVDADRQRGHLHR